LKCFKISSDQCATYTIVHLTMFKWMHGLTLQQRKKITELRE